MTATATEIEKVIAFVEPVQTSLRRHNDGYVISAVGEVVESELSYQGRHICDWLIDEIPADGCVGVMVWEGECENKWSMHHGGDWEPRLTGRWRKPTAHELWSLVPTKQSESACEKG